MGSNDLKIKKQKEISFHGASLSTLLGSKMHDCATKILFSVVCKMNIRFRLHDVWSGKCIEDGSSLKKFWDARTKSRKDFL